MYILCMCMYIYYVCIYYLTYIIYIGQRCMCTQAVALSLSLSLSLSSEKTRFSLSLVWKDLNVFTNLSSHAAGSGSLAAVPDLRSWEHLVEEEDGGGSGGGSRSEGGGAARGGPRETKGIFSTSHVCIRIYMYIYLWVEQWFVDLLSMKT
jgi:hypothetical protein